MSEQTQKLFGGKTVSDKYYIEQGTEQDHFFIEHEWHVICKVNTQLECICLGKGEAERICRLLNEDDKRKSAPRIDRDVQRYIINQIKSTISKAKDEHPYLDFCKYINAIKIIESLECE